MADYIIINSIRIDKDYESFTPEVYGRLTTMGPKFLLRRSYRSKREAYQVCQCSCGNIGVHASVSLRKGQARSCGCARSENIQKAIAATIIHGDSNKAKNCPEYNAWLDMRKRCTNPNATYFCHYGGRGIKICERWSKPYGDGYINFLADMGRKPTSKHSIDRIDVNGDYCPENCRWATKSEQARNKRNSNLLEAFGKKLPLATWAEEYNIPRRTLKDRIDSGMTLEEAFSHPKGTRYPKAIKNDVSKPTKQ